MVRWRSLPYPLSKETREKCSLSSYKQNKGKEKSALMQTELIISFFFSSPLPEALLSSIGPFGTPYKLMSVLDTTAMKHEKSSLFLVLLVQKSHNSGGRCLLPFAVQLASSLFSS